LVKVRTILNVKPSQMSDGDIDELFDLMCDEDEVNVNIIAFDTFLQGGGDAENYHGCFIDCDP
jgi:hypothetical protein